MIPIVFIAYWFLACVFSLEECGRYLETIKVYENKPADLIQGQMDMDYLSRVWLMFLGQWSTFLIKMFTLLSKMV